MKTKYIKKIGNYTVKVSLSQVSIIGPINTNFGVPYPDNIGHKTIFGNDAQLFGMEWGYGLTKANKRYINESIIKLAKKHINH